MKLTSSSLQFNGNRSRYRMALLIILVGLLASLSFDALAQTQGLLNPIDAKYKQFQTSWYNSIKGTAERLFWILVLVDFTWSGVIYVLEKNDIGEIVISNVKKILTIGFFYSLLKFSDSWIPAIINSFAQIGRTAGNVNDATPDGIVNVGISLAEACFAILEEMGMLDALATIFPVTLVALVTLLSFLFVAAQLLITLVESYLAIGAGVILLGFGGSRWTTDFATKYLQYAVGTGVKLMLIYLIVGVGQTLTAEMTINPDELIKSSINVMGVALVYAYLAIQIPSMATAMMSGSPSLTAGAMASTALTLGAAAAGAGAASVGAGKAASSGATGALAGAKGLQQALGAGLNAAGDLGLTGIGAASHAVGEVGKQALGMAAGGIGDAVSNGTGFKDKVANSTGAKIAANIEGNRGGGMSNANASSSGDSGAGASTAGTSSSAAGDASTAAVQAGDTRSGAGGGGSDGASPESMSKRIQNMQGFVPSDATHSAGINIELKHTAD